MNRKTIITCLSILLFVGVVWLWAADQSSVVTRTNAPMEVMGVGPEMFSDRGVAWVKALAAVIKEAIGELGIVLLAVYALKKSLNTQKSIDEAKEKIDETKEHLERRMDNQGERITTVALAATPGTVKIDQPLDEPIPVVATEPKHED